MQRRLVAVGFLFIIAAFFQNCSSGFMSSVGGGSSLLGSNLSFRTLSDTQVTLGSSGAQTHLRKACYCINCGEASPLAEETPAALAAAAARVSCKYVRWASYAWDDQTKVTSGGALRHLENLQSFVAKLRHGSLRPGYRQALLRRYGDYGSLSASGSDD